MTFDIIIYISNFFTNDEFMYSFSLLSKNIELSKRRKYINRINSSKLLYKRINCIINMRYIEHECKFVREMFAQENMTYTELLKDFISSFLKTKYYSSSKRHFIKMKYILRDKSNQYSKKFKIINIPMCYIYRVSTVKKKYILNHTPYAKALIY